MSLIPYYDSADGRLLNILTPETCERYVARGIALPIRARNGRITRLYAISAGRIYPSAAASVAAMRAAASQTTRRLRGERDVIIAPPMTREHRGHQPTNPVHT